jgi:hypothetical protein
MRLVTTGATPHFLQMWKSAVFVPKAYFETSEGSVTLTFSEPVGQEVQTPPCFTQNEQVHARAGIFDGSGVQRSANEMLPQWHFPQISMEMSSEELVRKQLRRDQNRVVGMIAHAAAYADGTS